jgi:hypothetical protein
MIMVECGGELVNRRRGRYEMGGHGGLEMSLRVSF